MGVDRPPSGLASEPQRMVRQARVFVRQMMEQAFVTMFEQQHRSMTFVRFQLFCL